MWIEWEKWLTFMILLTEPFFERVDWNTSNQYFLCEFMNLNDNRACDAIYILWIPKTYDVFRILNEREMRDRLEKYRIKMWVIRINSSKIYSKKTAPLTDHKSRYCLVTDFDFRDFSLVTIWIICDNKNSGGNKLSRSTKRYARNSCINLNLEV